MTQPNAHNEDVILGLASAALYTGTSINELAEHIDRGTGPPRVRIDGLLRFRVGDLDRWMQETN